VSARWLAGKVLAAFLTLIFVLVFNFFLFRVMGDPTAQLARLPRAEPEEIRQLQAYYGSTSRCSASSPTTSPTPRGAISASARSRAARCGRR